MTRKEIRQYGREIVEKVFHKHKNVNEINIEINVDAYRRGVDDTIEKVRLIITREIRSIGKTVPSEVARKVAVSRLKKINKRISRLNEETR